MSRLDVLVFLTFSEGAQATASGRNLTTFESRVFGASQPSTFQKGVSLFSVGGAGFSGWVSIQLKQMEVPGPCAQIRHS